MSAIIPTRFRFEVLERDEFTCQYCGAKAPDVVLHVDHVIPQSAGGSSEADNLVTACQDCNLGKGKSELRYIPDRILDRAGTAYARGALIRESIKLASGEASIPAEPKDAPAAVVEAIESDGHAIRVMVAASLLSQSFVAGAVGISVSYMSSLASGVRPVTEKLVGPLCAVTGSNLLRQFRDQRANEADGVSRLATALRESA